VAFSRVRAPDWRDGLWQIVPGSGVGGRFRSGPISFSTTAGDGGVDDLNLTGTGRYVENVRPDPGYGLGILALDRSLRRAGASRPMKR